MIKPAFDRFYRYAELTELLNALATEYPDLCAITSIGRSHEGREIWLATLTNARTGPAADKPAFWVDANIHATEVSPSTCALYALYKALSGYGSDPQLTRLLDTRALYIVPRANPDGAELFLDERHRRIRSSTRPYPLKERQDGLHLADVDGDGRVLSMRVRDPNGPWKAHPDDARLLIARDPAGGDSGPFYRILPEGEIQNYDGVTIKLARPLEGLDLNRNFPVEWAIESEQPGAGPYPTSEPEVRAMVQFIVDHPNITGAITFHTYSGVYLRPYGTRADDTIATSDLWTMQEIGKTITRLTGYPAVSVFHDFKYHPKETIKGVFDDWLYDHLGVYAWTCELWSPQRMAGIDMKKPNGGGYRFMDWFRQHEIEDDLKLLKWQDEALGGRGFVAWRPFTHPQLGEVEIGGWDAELMWRNPPPHLLEAEIAPHADVIFWHALISPELAFRDLSAKRVGESAWHVQAVVENTGWLPTSVSARAAEKRLVQPVELLLGLPEGARLVSGELKTACGQLEGRALKLTMGVWGGSDASTDRTRVEWVVEAPAGASLTVIARHDRVGKISATLTLAQS